MPTNRISFEGHKGVLFVESGKVEFYGAIFESMYRAVKLLRRLPFGSWYGPFFCLSYRGVVNTDGEVLLDVDENDAPMWFPDIEIALWYCKTTLLKKKNIGSI
jgi:hypothetical protein